MASCEVPPQHWEKCYVFIGIRTIIIKNLVFLLVFGRSFKNLNEDVNVLTGVPFGFLGPGPLVSKKQGRTTQDGILLFHQGHLEDESIASGKGC